MFTKLDSYVARKRRAFDEEAKENLRVRFSFAVSLFWFAVVIALLTARPAQPEVEAPAQVIEQAAYFG